MGTRADFYVGEGASAEWLGSFAFDGYPDGDVQEILGATDETAWREAVAAFLADRDDATLPADGWPWPWEDSRTTDYAYSLVGGAVRIWCFGRGRWTLAEYEARDPETDDEDRSKHIFPDMSNRQRIAVPGSQRSGVMVLKVPR